jgi:hypothetical protein
MAIALLDGDQCRVGRAATRRESREAQIPRDFRPSVIAVDGPLLPEGADEQICRLCETESFRGLQKINFDLMTFTSCRECPGLAVLYQRFGWQCRRRRKE